MAAYAALVPLARVIEQILPDDEGYISLGNKEQMESLHQNIVRLQKFLEYISGKSDSTLDELESRIRNVAFDLEDFMESKISRSVGQLPLDESDAAAFASWVDRVDILLKEAEAMAMGMKELSKKKRDRGSDTGSRTTARSSIEDPTTGDNITTGRSHNNALSKIFDEIITNKSPRKIFAITGMGGIGKTTLARAVYEDQRTLRHFDIRSRVTVSKEYDIKDLLQRLLDDAKLNEKETAEKQDKEAEKQDKEADKEAEKQDKEATDGKDEDLSTKMYKRLKGRRYLIILDDMWDKEPWEGVMNAFPNEDNASCIIITTRNQQLARCIDPSSHMHEMETWNEGESWDLLRKEVERQQPFPPEFAVIGKEIARNCKGLPLVIVVIAGILKINMTIHHWEEVAENTESRAVAPKDDIQMLISLSYTDLPPHLKACFLYMGAFPEDREIPTKELVMLWTAEGFLKPGESKRMEVVQKCLEELKNRSLVTVTNTSATGKITSVMLHDVIRDLSLTKAQEENFLYHVKYQDMTSSGVIKKGRRRLCLPTLKYLTCAGAYNQSVRTLLYRGKDESDLLQFISCCMLLKVLNKVHIYESSALDLLSRLTNLRYLHFVCDESYSPLVVPESISKLLNLETLVVSRDSGGGGECDVEFPLQIWEMPCLKHLFLMADSFLPDPAHSEGEPHVNCLHTLSGVMNLNFTDSVMKRIQNLKKLKVEYYYSGMEKSAYDEQHIGLNNLVGLHQLEELKLVCRFQLYESRRPTVSAFPENLTKLTLEETKLPWEKMSLVRSLVNLEVLKLKWESFVGDVWEQQQEEEDDKEEEEDEEEEEEEEEFKKLKYLKMEELGIKSWKCDASQFPYLEKLIIQSCWYLVEVPASIKDIYPLRTLIIEDCESSRESVDDLKAEVERIGSMLDVTFRKFLE